MAEWFKATDLRPVINDAWVRTPLLAKELFVSLKINTKAGVAEWFKATDSRPVIYDAWVQIPSLAKELLDSKTNTPKPG